MLSLFPTFLSWNQASPLLIRVALGAVFIYWSYKGFRKTPHDIQNKSTAVIEGLAAIFLILGYWTQLAAIVVGIDLIVRLAERIMKKSFLTDGVNYYLILLVLALSLLVTSAGWLAFDLAI